MTCSARCGGFESHVANQGQRILHWGSNPHAAFALTSLVLHHLPVNRRALEGALRRLARHALQLAHEEHGFPMEEFVRLKIGPIVIKHELEYFRRAASGIACRDELAGANERLRRGAVQRQAAGMTCALE